MQLPVRQTGHTLIELLTALAIGTALLACALPAYSRFTSVDEIRAAADDLAHGLRLARAEAIRRNEAVIFTVEPASRHWSVTRMNEESPIRSSAAERVDAHVRVAMVPTDAVSVVFGPLGISEATAFDTAKIEELIVYSTRTASLRRLRIKIEAVKIRVCDSADPSPTQSQRGC